MISLLILFFLISIGFSFLCSLWEAVLLSVTPSYAQIQQQQGARIGELLARFKEDIDRPLAAILTLNTIAHTVGAIGVGAQATLIWADTNPVITAFVVPALMTLGILVLSEIIPKTIGANYWRELAPFTVASLRFLILVLYPLVQISQLITRTLKKDKSAGVLTRSDFVAMAEIGAREGVFEQSESDIISNLLRFRSVQARDIMTPRTVVVAAPEDQGIRAFYEGFPDLRFSRIPTYSGTSKDQITGYVLKDDVLVQLVDGSDDKPLKSIRRDIIVVPETCPIPRLFSRFIESREHIALVVDEFGGMSGIVSMEDVIETLLGLEIVDESDSTTNMQLLARRNWQKRAKVLGLLEEVEGGTRDVREPKT